MADSPGYFAVDRRRLESMTSGTSFIAPLRAWPRGVSSGLRPRRSMLWLRVRCGPRPWRECAH